MHVQFYLSEFSIFAFQHITLIDRNCKEQFQKYRKIRNINDVLWLLHYKKFENFPNIFLLPSSISDCDKNLIVLKIYQTYYNKFSLPSH